MTYPFLPVNPCCTDVVINDPCGCSSTLPNAGCGQRQCVTNVILSSNVLYNGPVLDCIIAEPCDTLNVILQKIDDIICNLLTQINILNVQVVNINNQVIQINNSIININNTLDTCCVTTTSTTTLCPCTYYEYVSPSTVPGTFTYVECDTRTVTTVTGSNVVATVCVDNNYPTIEIGRIAALNTGECCTFITTTTTTTLPIEAFCNEVIVTGKVDLYWLSALNLPQILSLKDTTVYICAQTGSIAYTGGGSIAVFDSPTTCTTDGECVPSTTTTTSTTVFVPCTSYKLETTGPSTFPGDSAWEGLDCVTNRTVGGNITYPEIIYTDCIVDGSLLTGVKVIVIDFVSCEATTTTTTTTL